MSGISTGIGLISGIDRQSLINQLIALERRPLEALQARISEIDVQRTAFVELTAQLLSIRNTLSGMQRPSFFRPFNAASSNESALAATATSSAAPGSYVFRVRSLVTNHSMITRGFADADTSPVGAGTLTFEMGNGKVSRSTELDALNGGAGVRRGVITITDRGGASADFDLTTAVTIDDVLDAINADPTINVRAYVTGVASNGASGDRLVIEDLTAPAAVVGNLIIVDKGAGTIAADLGIAVDAAASRIDGRDLIRLSKDTPLLLLNDGNGVGRFRADTDLTITTSLGAFEVSLSSVLATQLNTDLRALNSGGGVRLGVIRITDRSGKSADIDLTGARTVNDIIETINAADVGVSVTIVNSSLQISDNTDTPDNEEKPPILTIEDLSGHAAADLGIADATEKKSIFGHEIYRVETVGDVINAINYASGNNGLVEARFSADGNGLTLRALGLDDTITVTAGTAEDGRVSSAAADLGLLDAVNTSSFTTRRLLAGLNTVLLQSLNGGRGVETGEVRLVDRAGRSTIIDFAEAHTLQDVIDLINLDASTGLAASVNDAGNGIQLRDSSTEPGQIVIEDVSGSLAGDLGISGAFEPDAGNVINGGNTQLQYITRRTELATLNNGRGISNSTFRITSSAGGVYTVPLDDAAQTVGDVIDAINRVTPDTIEARINDQGDGIIVIDHSAGTGSLTIEDRDGGRAAANLRLAGTARTGQNFVDGSYEIRIDIDAGDTLTDVMRKINEAGAGVSASLANYGSALNPYSLTLTSEHSGRRGEMIVDGIGVDLGLTMLAKAQDAVVTIGDGTTGVSRLITSSSNTIDDVIEGVTLDLLSVSDDPVTITVAKDVDAIVQGVSDFVDRYNEALNAIDRSTSFNADTLERGPLLGDSTINLVRQRLINTITRQFQGVDSSVSRLFAVGVRFGRGNRLQFDEERFREIYERSPELVEELFTEDETGFAAVLDTVIDDLTRDADGVVSRKDDLLSDQQDLINARIERLSERIEAKRQRLEAQFIALESVLAMLQGQQTALGGLVQLAGGYGR